MNGLETAKLRLSLIIALLMFLTCSIATAAAVNYQLDTGDVLEITVWGHPELRTVVQVRPDGYITFPLVGDHLATGKTTTQVAQEIQSKLQTYVVEPSVTVIITEFRTIRVQVLGEVRTPGYYRLKADDRLIDAIGQAGGPNQDALLSEVTVTRMTGEAASKETYDVSKYINDGAADHNPALKDGDVIYIPKSGHALVLGAVAKPGSYPIQTDMDLLDLIAVSGGALTGADLSQAVLTRKKDGAHVDYTVDLTSVMQSGKGTWSVQADDVLFIPEKKEVILFGEVRTPGSYSIETGTTLVQLISEAGGVTAMGDAARVNIVRIIGEQEESLTVDISDTLSGKPGANPRLYPGDIIYVPEILNTVLVLGEVRQPGAFVLKEQMGIFDVLALAGGTNDSAALERITITRQSEAEVLVQEIDLTKLQGTGTGREIELLPGDVIFVPEGAPQALVLGRVARPGSYRLTDRTKLLDLLAAAGGPLDSAGDRILLTRNESTVEIDLGALTRLGIGNQTILPGDVVYITEGKHQVLVLGEVANPGYHRLDFGDRVLDGIAKAGGLLDTAAADQVSVTRQVEEQAEVYTVNLEDLMRNRFLDSNFMLEGGDVIIVPEARRYVMVLGEVAKPGYYTFGPDQRLLDVIALAGGVTSSAAADSVQVSRVDADDNSSAAVYDLDAVMKGLSSDNPLVQAGDVVYVPERKTSVLVFGEVASPGYYPVTATTNLLDAIARAGGLTDRAAADQVSLTRIVDGTTMIETIDLQSIMESGHGNIPLSGGEMILVPELDLEVSILGEVRAPGRYTIRRGEKLLDVLAKAGGLTDRAAVAAVSLTRIVDGAASIEVIDLEPVMETGQGNVPLTGGEMILVPELDLEVSILGEVRTPGRYTIRSGERLLDVLAKAGGLTDDADPVLTITRSRGSEQTIYTVDYQQLVRSDGAELNMAVLGGDIIHVPRLNRRVLIFGEVARPGAYTIDEYTTLLDLVGLAGGPTERAKLDEVMIAAAAGGTEVNYLDLGAVIANQQPNPLLSGGEVVHIPQARQVLVMGEVARPGAFTLPEGSRILDLLALAGGLKTNISQQEIVITRQETEGEQVWITTYQALMSNQSEHNLLLAGGDVVFVPELSRQVLVLGEVTRPGVYTIYEGARVLDAIAMADGPTERANLGAVGIYRGEDLTVPSTLAVGQERVLFQGDARENPEIMGGDIIYVPETAKPDWNKILGLMSGVRTFQQIIIDWFIPGR